jgi:hypothetical protein
MWVAHQQVLALASRRGSIDVGVRRSEMRKFTYDRAACKSRLSRHLFVGDCRR